LKALEVEMEVKTQKMPIGYALEHVSSLLIKRLDQILLEQLGIGYAQFKILRVVGTHALCGQRQIADELGQTEASISRQIKLLQDDSLLQTKTDPSNRRQRLSRLTRKGQRFMLAAEALSEQFEQDMFEPLKPKEQTALQPTLARLHEHTHADTPHLPKSYLDSISRT
jgi:DNA-binding MarR family transcriptional regulator